MRFKKKNTKVFGVPVQEAAAKSIIGNGIPLPLTRCVDTIEREALTLEGVYRRTGDLGDVDKLIKMYDIGKDPDLLPYDPFVLTSLLKKYFTLLPEPITTYEYYNSFIAAKKMKERSDKVKGIRELVQKLPDINRVILYFLMQHLVRVSKYSGENKMSTTNLSIVFGPTLFRSTDNSSTRLLADAGHLGGCVEIMISNFDKVFDFMLPNQQISVKDDEEMIKLMSGSPSGSTNRQPLTTAAPKQQQAAAPADSEKSTNEGVIELKRDQKRIMSTRIGLNFVEISAQFMNETDNKPKGMQFEIKKPSEMISIPLPTPNRVSSPFQDDDDKRKKSLRTRRFTIARQSPMIEDDEKVNKHSDEEELILLKKKRHSSLTFNTTIQDEVNNILSDIVNNALLEQTSCTSLSQQKTFHWDDFGIWKRQTVEQYTSMTFTPIEKSKIVIQTELSDLDIRNMRVTGNFFEDGFLELDEEAFQKELGLIEIDLDRPLTGVTARINAVKKRLDLLTDNDEDSVPNLSVKELEVERVLLKRELVRFDRLWERERKRTIDRLAKLPLKPLYDRYRRICQVQAEKEEPKTPITPSHFSAPEKFISAKSPLFNTRRSESISRKTSNGDLSRVDASRNARKKTFQLVSPMSPDETSDKLTERAKLIGEQLQNREEYVTTKNQKGELKKKLHQFQDDFIRQNGRRVSSKNDKKPVEKEYEEYKRLKRWMKEKEKEVEREVDKILSV